MLIAENITDPGIGQTVVYNVVNLKPNTEYQFRVSAKNTLNNKSTTVGDVISVVTLGKLFSALNITFAVIIPPIRYKLKKINIMSV
jgi:phosphodiesterase/alkaline phosphatase D-like protein